DHIDRIACLLAWYVYDHYTAPPGGIPQAVNMLGHSMGGLVIRDAIARSGHDSGFPGPLRVLRAVAAASPMGSVAQPYSTLAPDTAQSNDMKSNSEFMQDMAGFQRPQGAGGTFWGLVGASAAANTNGCDDGAGGPVTEVNVLSCDANQSLFP